MIWLELKVTLIFFAMIFLPGWALLSLNLSWKKFPVLIRWIAASSLGVAFWPIFYYSTRLLLPDFRIGQNKLISLLILFSIFIIWRTRRNWKQQFIFDRWELFAISIIFITIFTRIFVAHLYPYPAWSDSLHHTLLTFITGTTGQLPNSLLPFESTPLEMYHLGLYALSGPLMVISGVPAHTALIWSSQLLNGLCGLGVYWVVDHFIGRRGAVFALAVIGIYSFQPAWFVNWGRFTQAASQFLIFPAWMFIIYSIQNSIDNWPRKKFNSMIENVLAGMVSAAVFLIHFRISALFLPLVFLAIIWFVWKGVREKKLQATLIGIFISGTLALLFVLPALIPSMKQYIALKSSPEVVAIETSADSLYYSWNWQYFTLIGSQLWIYVGAALGATLGLWKFRKFTLLMLTWSLTFVFYAFVYRLKIPILNISNFSGFLISISLLLSVFWGIGIESIGKIFSAKWQGKFSFSLVTIIFVLTLFLAPSRVSGIEEYRFFIQPADLEAMAWINEHLPEDAGFVINSYGWGDGLSHGTDAGYWIPYFTGRKTTERTMLFSLGNQEEVIEKKLLIKAAKELETGPEASSYLCEKGFEYVYIGVKGNFSGKGLDANKVLEGTDALLIYRQDGVTIIQLCSK